MRPSHAILTAVMALAAGCGGAESELVGTWTVDLEATSESLEKDLVTRAPGDDRKAVRTSALDLVRQKIGPPLGGTLDLRGDGTCSTTAKGRGAEKPFLGTWRFDGSQVTVTREGSRPQYLDYADGELRLRVPVPDPEDPAGTRDVHVVLKRSS